MLGACSNQSSRDTHITPTNPVHYGQVSAIEILDVESEDAGNAIVLGSVGGAISKKSVEHLNGHDSDIYRITVILENGNLQEFNYADINNLRVGDRVKVENGQIERL
jgi:hypothetical protein